MKSKAIKTRNLILSLGLLFSLGAAAATTSYAWFAVQQLNNVEQTNFFSGQLGIEVVSATAYKYVYPTYGDTDLIDYGTDPGNVSAAVITDVTGPEDEDSNGYLTLNKLDTTSIYLNQGAASDDIELSDLCDEIKGQNCSLLFKIEFTVTKTERVGFSLLATRERNTAFSYDDTTNNLSDSAQLYASDFLSFTPFLDPDLSSLEATNVKTLDTVRWEYFRSLYYGESFGERKFFHQNNNHGPDLTVLSTSFQKTAASRHTLYLFAEYEPTHVKSYLMQIERLRYSYHLESDYHFVLQLSSEVNA